MHEKGLCKEFLHLLVLNQHFMVNHDKLRIYTLYVVDDSVGSFPYQVSMAVYRTVMPLTGNEESGFDFGEGA